MRLLWRRKKNSQPLEIKSEEEAEGAPDYKESTRITRREKKKSSLMTTARVFITPTTVPHDDARIEV
jgi:hypothetical protein